ncbi:hypothetical protein SAMN05216420_101382 [Nitrosospira sp. Nl5]|uniref:hypothetical protein n=1 Tax=Nitrosospira sp. Nl5 TaxID=200120 RepID=UPI00088C4A73|nr:hypothetical protein [Nitrosospira sp. Nl5]SCX93593.1 hypothetical protein SAMN05216420_101382 [Nitrosospira sp. Nl5]
MALRCKKGDMAIVLDPEHSAYGWIVDVVYFHRLALLLNTSAEKWEVCRDVWVIEHANLSKKCGCEDKYLLPIRPGDLNETEETEKKLEFSGR